MRRAAAVLVVAGLVVSPAAAGKRDKKAPSVPKGLVAQAASSTQIDLSWSASTDNVGVAGYRIYRGGTQIGTAPGTSYSALGLSPDTDYTFGVAAYDAAGNVSKKSKITGHTQPGGGGGGGPPPPGPPPTGLPLIQPANLVYQGAFLLPEVDDSTGGFSYGGTALAYNPGRNSLFAVGHDWYQLSAEVSIPALVNSTSLGDLNTAALLQPFRDATNGKIDDTGGSNSKVGGQLVYNGRLYGTAWIYYDATGSQVVSHWYRPSTSLSTGTASGLFQLGSDGAGMVSGYLADVPAAWQPALGGPALTGNCCIPIISRTSYGPAAFSFDPAAEGTVNPVPVAPLVYYPQAHAELGDWSSDWNPGAGLLYNGNTQIRGVVFPVGTSTVLFFGTQGTGPFCYGEGTDDPSLNGKPTPDGTIWCYDPDVSYKGTHGYPYVPEVWAYDANDLYAVRTGAKQPWEVRPYATWTLSLPFGSPWIGGAAYDAAHGVIYVSQQYGNGTDPLIHAFRLG